MITTTKGDMDEALLEKKVGESVIDTGTMEWVEYWLGSELVHRSVHVKLNAAVASGDAASF